MTSPSAISAFGRRLRILRKPSEPIRPSAPRPARRDCHGRLQAALLALAGDQAEVRSEGLRPWCSATFVGMQHRLSLDLAGVDAPGRAAVLADVLPEHEFHIPSHLVADLAVDNLSVENGKVRIGLCILTIEEW